jgi:hypothetical protein
MVAIDDQTQNPERVPHLPRSSAPRQARRLRTRQHASAVFLLIALAVPATGAAQSQGGAPAETEALARRAQAACLSGRMDEGVRILAELFAQTDDGNYIFNQGRCYQENGRPTEAVARFRMYLGRSDAEPAVAARARQYIEQLQPPAQALVDRPSASPPIGETLRSAGLATAAAGLAGLAAAAYFGVRTSQLQKDANGERNAPRPDPLKLDEINKRGEQAEFLHLVSLGVGATALAAGALLYYLGARAPSGVEVTPVAWSDGGRVMLRLSF